MPRPSNTEERRKRIVEGLLSAMARHGYGGATIHAIAAEAGLAPGLVHYHFKSKREILLALIGHIRALVESRYQAFSAKARNPRQHVAALIDAYLSQGPGASPKAVAAWVAIGAEAIRQKEVRAAYAMEIRGRQTRLRALLSQVPGLRDASSRAAGITALMEGAFQVAAAAPGVLPRGYAAGAAKAMLGPAAAPRMSRAEIRRLEEKHRKGYQAEPWRKGE